jgi:hypothetical protein
MGDDAVSLHGLRQEFCAPETNKTNCYKCGASLRHGKHIQPKRFSITARKRSSELDPVTKYMKDLGYKEVPIASGLNKLDAEDLKKRTRKEYEDKGYVYQTRDRDDFEDWKKGR